MTNVTRPDRVEREARLKWVPIPKMATNPTAQRELNQNRVDHILSNFDLEQIGTPTVNLRNGSFWIIDGQHRIEAMRQMGWEDQQVQCWTYEGLTEEEEAEKFLKLNDTLTVNAFAKFHVAVQAGRPVECDIDRIVKALGLTVTKAKQPGAIGAVGTLTRIYNRAGAGVLRQTLMLVRDSFGDAGFDAAVIDGLGLFVQRYAGEIDFGNVVTKLAGMNGGSHGLLGKSEALRKQTRFPKGVCVAAAVVEVVNSGRGGNKLSSWWREGDPKRALAVA